MTDNHGPECWCDACDGGPARQLHEHEWITVAGGSVLTRGRPFRFCRDQDGCGAEQLLAVDRQQLELEGVDTQLQLELPPTTDPERKGWNRR